jgi:hypothetical protein
MLAPTICPKHFVQPLLSDPEENLAIQGRIPLGWCHAASQAFTQSDITHRLLVTNQNRSVFSTRELH